MRTEIGMIAGAAFMIGLCASGAMAQTAKPTYEGDPDVYKVIFEDANFRVIAVDRKKGVHDHLHGHPLPSIVYNITDCTTKQYRADGKTVETVGRAGSARAIPVIAAHSAENIGNADCKQLFVEKKGPATTDSGVRETSEQASTGLPRDGSWRIQE